MTKTILTIDGMACSMCEAHICEAIRRACRPKKLRASHKSGTAELLTEQPPDAQALRAAVEETGYLVLDLRCEPYRKRGLFGW